MTQRDRIVLGVVATAVVLAGFWFLLLSPRREAASAAAADVTAAQTRVDSARSKLAGAETAKREYNARVLQLARLGKAVPPNDDMPSLLYQLERTARDAGINFQALKLEGTPAAAAAATADATAAGSAAAASGLKPMPFKLTFKGEFFQLRRFLDHVHSFTKVRGDDLDARGRLVAVDGISMAPDGNVYPVVTAHLVVTAYTAPAATADPAAAAAPGAPAAPGATTPGTTPPSPTAQSSGSTPPPANVGGPVK